MPKYNRLVITAPSKGGLFSSFPSDWNKVRPLFMKFLRQSMWKECEEALQTGLPYHLPFSFESSEAEDFGAGLKAKGWGAVIVPSELQ